MDIIQLKPSVIIDPQIGQHRIVHLTDNNRYFRMGVNEACFLESLDGSKSINQLHESCDIFSSEQIDSMLDWFKQQALLVGYDIVESEKPSGIFSHIVYFIKNPDKWKISLGNPDAFFDRNINIVHGLFSKPAIAFYLFSMLSPLMIYALSSTSLNSSNEMSTLSWVTLYLLMIMTLVFHELAHGAACKHYGGKVPHIGIMFMYLHPMMYCDVTDIWRFKEANHKIVVVMAGIFLHLILACLATSIYQLTGVTLFKYYAILNVFFAIFNCFPLIKLDGYWALVHLLDEPKLKNKAIDNAVFVFRKYVLFDKKIKLNDGLKGGFLIFGLCHLIIVPLFWLTGIWSIYRHLSYISNDIAIGTALLFSLIVIVRMVRGISEYFKIAEDNLKRTV